MRNYTEKELREVLGQDLEVSEQVEQRLGDVYSQIRTGKVKRRRRRTGLYTAAGTAAAVFAAGVFCVSNPAIAAKLPVIGHIFEDIGETAPYPGNYSEVATVLTEEDGSAAADDSAAKDAGLGDVKQADAQGSGTSDSGIQAADVQDSGMQAADAQGSGTAEAETQTADAQGSGTSDSGMQAADAQGSGAQDAAAKYTQTSDGLTVTLSEVYCNDLSLYLTMQVQSEEPLTDLALYEDEAILFLRGNAQFDFMEESSLADGSVYGKMIDENTFIGIYRLDLAEATTDYSAYNAELERLEAEGIDVMMDAEQEALNALLTRTGLPEQFHVQFTFDQVVGDKAERLSIHDVLGLENPTEEELMAMSDEEWHAYMQDLYNKVPDYNDFPNQYQHIWFDGPFTFDLDVTVDRERTKVVQVDGDAADDGSVHVKSVTLTPFELSADVVYPVGTDGILQAIDAQGKRLSNGTHGGSTDMYAIEGHDMSKVDLYYLPWDAFEQSVKGLKGDYFDTHETNEDGKTLKDLLEENSTYHREVVFE